MPDLGDRSIGVDFGIQMKLRANFRVCAFLLKVREKMGLSVNIYHLDYCLQIVDAEILPLNRCTRNCWYAAMAP
jgi:hypothetical protein